MTLTYCGIFLNIMVILLHIDSDSNEYQDLVVLQRIARSYNYSEVADVTELLKVFREQTGLKLSIEDLYVYFSNLGVFKI